VNLLQETVANIRGLWLRYVGLFVLAVLAVSAIGAGRLLVGVSMESTRAGVTESVAQRAITVQGDREPGGRVLDEPALAALAKVAGVASSEPVYSLPVDLELPDLPLGVDLVPVRSAVPPPLVESARAHVFPLGPGEIVVPSVVDGRDMRGELGRRVIVGHPHGMAEGSSTSERSLMTVVGLVDPSWQDDGPRTAYARASVTRQWYEQASLPASMTEVMAQQGYDKVTVLTERAGDVEGVLRRIQALGLVAVSFQQMTPSLPDVMTTISRLTDYAQWLLVAICVVAVFVVVRSLTAQRTREIGLLKALGHRSARVTAGLYLESLAVSWMACLVSVGGSVLLANVLRPLLPDGALPRGIATVWAVDWSVVGWSVVASALVVALGGALPFLRSLRLPAAEALRDFR
jgi:putative ABC transport system permease protein